MPNRLKATLAILLVVCMASATPAQTTALASIEAIAGQVEAVGGMVSVVCSPGMEGIVVPLAGAVPGGFFVHALVAPLECAGVREQVVEADMTGRVAVSALDDAEWLPYESGLLNVVVFAAEALGESGGGDVFRVLAPLGRGFVRIGTQTDAPRLVEALRRAGVTTVDPLPGNPAWLTFRKPWPNDIGEWGHHLHAPDNNPVTPDLRVGPPRRLQWTAGPRWSRNHESAGSLPAMVSAAGRLFAVIDEGPIGISAENVPDKWVLIARDAFNGRVLWKRPIGDWGWRSWRKDWITRSVPPSMARGLVAVGDRVVVTDRFRGDVLILNAVDGELLYRCPDTGGTHELILSADVIFAVQQDEEGRRLVRAVSSEDGNTLWTQSAQCGAQTLCVLDSRVFWWEGATVVAHDRVTGEQLWRSGELKKSRWGQHNNLIAVEGTLLAASHGYHGSLTALDAESGRQLWQTRARGGYVFSAPDIFVIDSTVWADGHFEEWLPERQRKQIADGNVTREEIPAICRWPTFMKVAGRELRTGELLREIDTGGMFKTGHHHRCYRCRATPRFIMAGRRGTEFVDLQGNDFSVDNWVRGSCQFGFMPANGLLYAPPHPCSCYLSVKLTGFNALAPASPPAAGRLRRAGSSGGAELGNRDGGVATPPAAGRSERSGSARKGEDGWPTFRGDSSRSGSTPSTVEAVLQEAWRVHIGGRLTQPVVSRENVLVASIDAGMVHAVHRDTGKPDWCFNAGGRIDSPPSIVDGLVVFGCHDGYLYCLRLSDGGLVWQRRLAPQDRLIGDHGRLASAWPVHGAVLVTDGVVYAAAGRASVLEEGIRVWGLDLDTGAVRCRATLDHTFGDPRKVTENNSGLMHGFLPDVLLREGDSIFMRHAKFGLNLETSPRDGNALLAARVKHWGKVWGVQGTAGDQPHLVAGSGLLDGTMFNRMSWVRADAAGQLIVWNRDITCTVNMFRMPKRKLLSPVFFPGTDGDLVTGRKAWDGPACPQSVPLEPPAEECLWQLRVPLRIEAMVLAGETLFIAGQPDQVDRDDPLGAFEGRKGGQLIAIDSRSGRKLHELVLNSPPVFDGLAAAHGRLWLGTRDGSLVSLAEPR